MRLKQHKVVVLYGRNLSGLQTGHEQGYALPQGERIFLSSHVLRATHPPWLPAPSSLLEASRTPSSNLSLSPLFLDPCAYIGPTQIIQGNLPVSRPLTYVCKAPFTYCHTSCDTSNPAVAVFDFALHKREPYKVSCSQETGTTHLSLQEHYSTSVCVSNGYNSWCTNLGSK